MQRRRSPIASTPTTAAAAPSRRPRERCRRRVRQRRRREPRRRMRRASQRSAMVAPPARRASSSNAASAAAIGRVADLDGATVNVGDRRLRCDGARSTQASSAGDAFDEGALVGSRRRRRGTRSPQWPRGRRARGCGDGRSSSWVTHVAEVGRSSPGSWFPARSSSARAARPRAMRLLTVPIGMSSTLGDLGVVEVGDVAEHDRHAEVLRQLRRAPRRSPAGRRSRRGATPASGSTTSDAGVAAVDRCASHRRVGPPPPAAQLVEAGVGGDAVHPRAEATTVRRTCARLRTTEIIASCAASAASASLPVIRRHTAYMRS